MAASPFNAVKLAVIVIGCGGVLLAAALGRAQLGAFAQLLILGGYGMAGALWVVWRTRRILKRVPQAASAQRADSYIKPQDASSTDYGQK